MAPGCSSCCAKSLGTGEAEGVTSLQLVSRQAPLALGGDGRKRASLVSQGHPSLLPNPHPTSSNPSGSVQFGSTPPPRGFPLIGPWQQRPLGAEKEVSKCPLHINYLTIKTPYKNVKFLFGIVSVLARQEEWETLSALRREKTKGFGRKLNDSTKNRKPTKRLHGTAAAPSCPKTP